MPKEFNLWAEEAMEHWRVYRPRLYKELVASGALEERAVKAAESASKQYVAYIESGMDPLEAQSEAKRNYLFLPCEADEPELGADPTALHDPASLVTTPGPNRPSSPDTTSKRVH